MSRASISTGDILFNTTKKQDQNQPEPRDDNQPMHIAIIGDFSGRGSRDEIDAAAMAKRKAIEVDRDNFEDTFSALNVELKLPVSDENIRFSEFDDLHPDFLYNNVSLFEKFRALKRKLKKPEFFDDAVKEIHAWTDFKNDQPATPVESSPDEGIPLPDNLLDALLTKSDSAQRFAQSPIGDIDQIIKDVISPYVEAKTDPRLPEMQAAVDAATADALRTIMHAGAFQELEANWLGLYFLVRRLETNRNLKIFILDISRDELIDDLINSDNLETSNLYQLLVEKYQIPGATPFSIFQCNFHIEDDIDDLVLASAMANIAMLNNGVAIAGVSEKLAGCEGFDGRDDVEEWRYELDENIIQMWENLRQSSASAHIALTAPRFLLRLPYGKKSSPVEQFDFEELAVENAHPYYCWGNSAHLVSLLLAQSYKHLGWDFNAGQLYEVAELPLHIYQDEDDESVAKACAEFYMRDSAAEKLGETGILSVRSMKGQAAVIIPNFRTLALNGRKIFEK